MSAKLGDRLPYVTLVAALAMGGAVLFASGTARGQSPTPAGAAKPTTVLFMCPHGAGDSVLAAAYFQKLAKERGLNVRVDAVGTDPGPVVGPTIAEHLTRQGYAIPIAKPRAVTADDLTTHDVVVSMQCDLTGLPTPKGSWRKWDDVPLPTKEEFARADSLIKQHVAELVDELVRQFK